VASGLGTTYGVVGEVQGPRPTALDARTRNSYVAPLVKPNAVQKRLPGLAMVQVTGLVAPGVAEVASTMYGVVASSPGPPSEAGADQVKTAVVGGKPAAVAGLRGTDGTTNGDCRTSAVLLTSSEAFAVVTATTLMS